jgi:hypothetical protein
MSRPSADALRALIGWIGQQLPPSYLQFVGEHDGAEPEENSLATRGNEVGVRRFIPVSEAAALAEGIAGFPARLIPLAEDGCGNYFYLEPNSGSVHFWDHEAEGPDEQVASAVSAFVAELKPLDVARVKLAREQVERVWVDPSFKPEF